MYISARERQILEILLSEQQELTVKDLADKIAVSVRTIHRDLKNVELTLGEYGLSLQKKSGVGIQVTGDEHRIRELELFLVSFSHAEYTPEERQTLILCSLLESKGPVKLVGLAADLHVTIATISNDLTRLEERLKVFELSLLRRRGYGVELSGSEGAKRRAMRSIIADYMDESEFLLLAKENIQKKSTQQSHTISERLMGLVEKQKLLIVEKAVEAIRADLPYSMADSAYIGLVVHLALAIERIEQGESIIIHPGYLEEQQSTKEYIFAEKLAQQLERALHIHIPEAEIGYITMHLRGAKLRYDKEYLMEDYSLQIALKTKHLIQYVGEQLGENLMGDQSLFEGLVIHLKPALYRIRQNMGISNPLLEKIKGDYPGLFSLVKNGMTHTFPELHIPDEEIGYLVMHFGAVALMDKRETEKLNVLVICSSGIGTSKMLATRLQREFPEIESCRNISLFELAHIPDSQYDLVVSTIPLPDFQHHYILVSPILDKSDAEKIRTYMQSHVTVWTGEKRKKLSEHEFFTNKSTRQVQRELQLIKEYAEATAAVLQNFEVRDIQHKPIPDMLLDICMSLADKQIVDRADSVVHSLLQREKLGGLGIPGTSLVLFHTRAAHVLTPFFSIYTLESPLEVRGMDNRPMTADIFLMLLSSESPSNQVAELLSYISALLIESEDSISLFESKDYERISTYLTTKLDAYFNDKIKEIRSV